MAVKMNGNDIRCSFCNKTQSQVRKLIAGPAGVYICDECIDICADILEEELEEDAVAETEHPEINLLKPMQIKSFLDEYVVGQEEAKKVLAVSVYNIPGFEDALIGAEIGRETEVNVTFPEDYQAAELAGKPAVFKCTVKKLQEKQIPALDEDFVSEVSDESDTVEEYKEEIRKNLSDKKEADAKNAKEDAVIDAIIEDAKMEIPDAMVETQQRQLLQDYAQRMQAQGISMEQYMQFTGLTSQALMEQVKPQALKRIQSRLVLEAVVAAENLTATEEDFEEEVKTMAEIYQMEADKVKELLGENGKKQVLDDICVKKAVEFVVDNAKEEKAAKKTAAKKTTKKAKEEAAETTEEA